MKHRLLVILFMSWFSLASSQDKQVSVEKSTFGIQAGPVGLWVHNEFKLSSDFALRAEIGMEMLALETGIQDDEFRVVFLPVLNLEPRWYYNLKRRHKKAKPIEGNSADFITIRTSYHPDFFVLNLPSNTVFINDLSVIPTWGIRRNFDEHLHYEMAAGVGYIHYFEKENTIPLNDPSNVAINLHLRIGYRF